MIFINLQCVCWGGDLIFPYLKCDVMAHLGTPVPIIWHLGRQKFYQIVPL